MTIRCGISVCRVLPALLFVVFAFSGGKLEGQGCILARSSSVNGGPETQGGYLAPGEFDFSIGYRHQFSFRHFVGDVEQTYRIQQGTQVENKINLLNFNLDYQISRRFSVQVDAPLLFASRRSNNSPYTTTSQGIGDTIISAQGWVWNPAENKKGNVAFSLGAMFPTGNDHVMNRVDKFDGKGPTDVLVDYSIQPGSGGYGILFAWQSFQEFWKYSPSLFQRQLHRDPAEHQWHRTFNYRQAAPAGSFNLRSISARSWRSRSHPTCPWTCDYGWSTLGGGSGPRFLWCKRRVSQAWICRVDRSRRPVHAWTPALYSNRREGDSARSYSQLSRQCVWHPW
jgi:hypothetical protein